MESVEESVKISGSHCLGSVRKAIAASLGEVRMRTYTPWELPPGFKTGGPLSFIEACRGKPAQMI